MVHTFDLVHLTNLKNYIPGSIFSTVFVEAPELFGYPARLIGFLALFIGFAIKLPAFPVHTWLPDAHVQAPTSVSVIFAGILLKVGGYGLLRIAYPLFPVEAVSLAPYIAGLGMVSILWGAYNALAQQDMKKMVAYSSISHMGFVLIGISSLTPEGVGGAVFQMFSHGMLASMLFLIVGVIYDRTGNRMIDSYKGIAKLMPYFTAITTVAFFASLGLPGFSAFIAEVFVFLGGFSSEILPKWITIVSLSGIVLGAAYMLWTLQRVFFGPLWVIQEDFKDKLVDLDKREYLMLVPLGVLAIFFGIFPSYVFDWIMPSIENFIQFVK